MLTSFILDPLYSEIFLVLGLFSELVRVWRDDFCPSETKFLHLDPLSRGNSYLGSVSWVRMLSGTAQGTESLVNQAKERFERIGRAEFDVNTSDARFEPSGNLKES